MDFAAKQSKKLSKKASSLKNFSHFSTRKRESWKHRARPFPKVGFLSRVFFCWVWKVICTGWFAHFQLPSLFTLFTH